MLIRHNKALRPRPHCISGPEECVIPCAIIVEVHQEQSPVIHRIHFT